MRVICCNVNGIRAATRKGLFEWLRRQKADFICLQEIKARQEQIPTEALLTPYHHHFSLASRPGYSGVALYSLQAPLKIGTEMGLAEMDNEGRYLQADYKNLTVISVYFPSGSSGDARQAWKYKFLDSFMDKARELRKKRRQFIVCGDFNIAHKKIDIKNWRGNQKNSGFLPEERAWMDRLIDEECWVDAFRTLNNKEEQYTWWSNRGRAYENNVGWRIDYQMVTPGLKDNITKVNIYKRKKFSDHAPLIIEYDFEVVN